MAKIVVDSGCDINDAIIKHADINLVKVPLSLQIDDKHFIDDENLDVSQYIEIMERSDKVARTAAPSPELYMHKYEGEESVFAVTLSSKLSGSYNSAILAKDMYISEVGNKFIHVFDSLSASVAEMLIALKANEFAKKHLPDSQVVENVNSFIANMRTFFILDKYDNLVKNGRMNQYVAMLASMLSIKAVCTAKDGEIALVDKARGFNKTVAKLVNIIEDLNYDFENRILGISHVASLEKALYVKDEISKRIKFKEIFVVETGGLCSTYAQKLGIILSF